MELFFSCSLKKSPPHRHSIRSMDTPKFCHFYDCSLDFASINTLQCSFLVHTSVHSPDYQEWDWRYGIAFWMLKVFCQTDSSKTCPGQLSVRKEIAFSPQNNPYMILSLILQSQFWWLEMGTWYALHFFHFGWS